MLKLKFVSNTNLYALKNTEISDLLELCLEKNSDRFPYSIGFLKSKEDKNKAMLDKHPSFKEINKAKPRRG